MHVLPCAGDFCNLRRFLRSLTLGRNDRRFLRWLLQIQMYHDAGPRGRMAMNHRRYIGYTVYCVVPFNRAGCNSNVAGVVPFSHSGYIRNAPGTAAAVPYGFADRCIFEPMYSKNEHVRHPKIVNCQLSIVNLGKNCQLLTVNCHDPRSLELHM